MIRILFTINNLETAGMRFVLADIAKALDKETFQVAVGVNRNSHSNLEQELQKSYPVYQVRLRLPIRPAYQFPFHL